MSGHTPTPWEWDAGIIPPDGPGRYSDIYVIGEDREPITIAEFNDSIPEGRANARRIVAAVNGTSTLTVEALEAGVVDKLVEAASVAVEELDYIAEFAMRQTEWTGDDDAALLAVKNLRAALALARGEQA